MAVLTLDHAPVNSLANGVRQGLSDCLKQALSDGTVKAIVVRGANNTFCAGAEISEFATGISGPSLPEVIDQMEACSKPVVACVQKFALGGGLEVALGCHYRVAEASAKLGLPEINLGLLPGAGGTQRLPKIIGAEHALSIMLSGIPVSAKKALGMTIIDDIVPQGADALDFAVQFAVSKISLPLLDRRASQRQPPSPRAPLEVILQNAAKQMAKARRGEVATESLIRCVKAAYEKDYAQGIEVEREEFFKLAVGPQARAMQHMFFAERQANKIVSLPKSVKPVDIKSLGIVGAGLMGGGIAMCALNVGIRVVLLDINKEALDRGLAIIKGNYARSMKRGKLTEVQIEQRLSLLTLTTQYEGFSDVDMVIEAVFENMDIKKKVFRELDRVCKPGAFLCTNTSALDIDEIASATKRPEFVIGTHFFSPANVMKLLENVKGAKSSDVTVATAMAFGKKIKKVTVLVGNCFGFVGNRMLGFYTTEAVKLLVEGALPAQVDKVAVRFGMPMGPLQMMDLVGLDLHWRERKRKGVDDPQKNIVDALCEMGRLGQKTKKGYYNYDDNRRPIPDEGVNGLIVNISKNLGVTRRQITDQEIETRLFFPLINEGYRILEEGFAQRPSDIDVVYIYGYGFPRFRGGPMKYADEIGPDVVLKELEKMPDYEPSELLRSVVAEGKGLTRYWKKHAAKIPSKL